MKRLMSLLMMSFMLTACLLPPPPSPQTGSDSSTESLPTANDQSSQNQNQPSATSEAESHSESDAPHTSDVDLTRLEVGDGKYSYKPASWLCIFLPNHV